MRRRPFWPPVALVVLVCASCGDGGGGSGAQPISLANYPGGADAIAWGDSWTSGVGADPGTTYPEQLAAITSLQVFNAGISGQTSQEIAARQGGAPALLTLPHDRVPETGHVVVNDQSAFPVTESGPSSIAGTLGGLHGTLNFHSGNLEFDRDTSGVSVSVPPDTAFFPDVSDGQSRINVFWIGGNNPGQPTEVLADVAACVNFLSTDRFVVLSLLNPASAPAGSDLYDKILSLNDELSAAYPDHYLDVRAALVDAFDPGRPQDVIDHAADVPPSSLRSDDQHPNTAGYSIVAGEIASFLATKGWL